MSTRGRIGPDWSQELRTPSGSHVDGRDWSSQAVQPVLIRDSCSIGSSFARAPQCWLWTISLHSLVPFWYDISCYLFIVFLLLVESQASSFFHPIILILYRITSKFAKIFVLILHCLWRTSPSWTSHWVEQKKKKGSKIFLYAQEMGEKQNLVNILHDLSSACSGELPKRTMVLVRLGMQNLALSGLRSGQAHVVSWEQ